MMEKSYGVIRRTLFSGGNSSSVIKNILYKITGKIITRKIITSRIPENLKNTSGSVAIETAIALPFFLCVAITLIYSIKVICVHEIIQHALNQTANEISQLSYVYHSSDIGEFLEESGGKLLITLDEELNKMPHIPGELRGELYTFIEEMCANDLEKLYSDLARLVMKKYLVNDKMQDADEVLRKLNIISGMDGLDMSMSGFFENKNNDIDLMVKYKINIPAPIKIFYPLCLVNRAVARAWLYGDEKIENEEDIWSLDNFTRGRKIRTIFGANLPFSFPVIAKFDQGDAIMIKSMDLTAKSYQDAQYAGKRIQAYINELAAYKGQEKAWGKKGIIIRPEDIKMKKIILVIPRNPIRDEIEEMMQECKNYAAKKGLVLEVQRYGYKTTDLNPKGK